MKHLIYFLLFSTVVFSQNFNYAIDEPKKSTVLALPVVNNQLEEIEYFNAYLLPITKKATLQVALNTYGSVRLEKGDYSGVDIVMTSNQKLYGHSLLTTVSNITIAAGSSNVVLENLLPFDKEIIFQAGGLISNCRIKSIKWATLKATNAMLENNTFINYAGAIDINCTSSGYFRNNKFIRHQSGGLKTVLVMKGNSTTPSYGNVHLWTNFLTPAGDATNLDNLQSATFVGIDAEAWNFNSIGTKGMFYATGMGKVKIADFGGGNGKILPSYDIDATEVSFFNKVLFYQGDVISPRTNMFLTSGDKGYIRGAGTQTGTDFLAHLNSKKVNYNSIDKTALITGQDATNITNSILGTQYTPWARPTWETLPDPLGVKWKTERLGKPDSVEYIQNLINTKRIAELPEGIFYIGSTLKIPLDSNHGITGSGTGKTVICGLTDDFPLISLTGGQDDNFALANLTLQGGNAGVYSSKNFGSQHMAIVWLKYVVFRDQNYGIHLDEIIGFDNNFMDNLSFVNCNKAFYQQPKMPQDATDTTCFVDKTMFYNGQFINCQTGISMLATRANNLNAWVNCKFDGGQKAFDMLNNNIPIIANCNFSNYSGQNIIRSNTISIYNSIFTNNSSAAVINSVTSYIEGSQFLDYIPVFSFVDYNAPITYLLNSVFNGTVVVPDNGASYTFPSAIYMNSLLNANPTLNKLLVKVENKVPTVLINATPNPYPQLLVTQEK